ncbi:SUMF1/EgtB/PvdO family nonheme iron enzyme [bacterium]|nr:SUMF1/EgtB/PvdO family nonheme iron enzyme [candidate division CSSED10-310 bacterium]
MRNRQSSFKKGQIIHEYKLIQNQHIHDFGELWLTEHNLFKVKRTVYIITEPVLCEEIRSKKTIQFQLDHPQIVKILDAYVELDPPYLVMSLIEGVSLRDILDKQHSCPIKVSLDIVIRLISILEDAHKQNVIHQNLRPESIFIDNKRNVMIQYFRLGQVHEDVAKKIILTSQDELVVDSMLKYWYYYMSPEQKQEETIDCRSDIYSLGLILFELLTGKQMLNDLSGELRAHNIPEEVIKIAAKATADLNGRYSNVSEMKKDIELYLSFAKDTERIGVEKKLTEIKPDMNVDEQIQILRLDADKLERSGDFETAMEMWQKVVELRPDLKIAELAIDRLERKLGLPFSDSKTDKQAVSVSSSFKKIIMPTVVLLGIVIILGALIYYGPSWYSNYRQASVAITPTPVPKPTVMPTPTATRAPTSTPVPTAVPTPVPTRTPKPKTAVSGSAGQSTLRAVPLEGFVFIPPVAFKMGSGNEEYGRRPDERLHVVSISNGFYIGQTEVTQKQWNSIMNENPSSVIGSDYPVDRVSFYDAIVFCNALSLREGLKPCYYSDSSCNQVISSSKDISGPIFWKHSASGYRLPTEAEWEVACRAGSTEAYSWGDDWNCLLAMAENDTAASENACTSTYKRMNLKADLPAPVRSFPPNNWQIFDMHGNLQEWCWDYYATYPGYDIRDPIGPPNGEKRVLRGGSWNHIASRVRSASRECSVSSFKASWIGFRLARYP